MKIRQSGLLAMRATRLFACMAAIGAISTVGLGNQVSHGAEMKIPLSFSGGHESAKATSAGPSY
jgi:hypothetical protein